MLCLFDNEKFFGDVVVDVVVFVWIVFVILSVRSRVIMILKSIFIVSGLWGMCVECLVFVCSIIFFSLCCGCLV